MPLTDEQRAVRKTRQALQTLSDAVLLALSKIDEVMKEPASAERDSKFAKISNFLEMQNDSIRFSTLGVDYTKDDKKKALKAAENRFSK